MARRKNAPDIVKVKCGVADRLRDLRTELFGERGGPELARQLGLPVRTWYNYEAGVTVPAEIVLRLIELTSVEASWLLHGTEPKFRVAPSAPMATESTSVVSLLRSAIQRLEKEEGSGRHGDGLRSLSPTGLVDGEANEGDLGQILVCIDHPGHERLTSDAGPHYIAARREWQAAESDHRCLLVTDDSMAPLVPAGAYVAYSDQDESVDGLDGRLVVAWIAGEPAVVRRFQNAGRFILLQTENPPSNPISRLIEISDPTSSCRYRLVSWISTPR
jgi:hypothetical protein